jgi:acetoin utilization protein AcuB
MRRLTVQNFMTLGAVVIGSDGTLAEAHAVMRARGIRHLPVVDGGRLVGVVSQRDLYLLETLRGVDREAERVREAMTPDPFTAAPDAPLDEVAARMAEHKYGSAVVVDRGSVIGVFTTIDALRALAAIARRKRARSPRTAGSDSPETGSVDG